MFKITYERVAGCRLGSIIQRSIVRGHMRARTAPQGRKVGRIKFAEVLNELWFWGEFVMQVVCSGGRSENNQLRLE